MKRDRCEIGLFFCSFEGSAPKEQWLKEWGWLRLSGDNGAVAPIVLGFVQGGVCTL